MVHGNRRRMPCDAVIPVDAAWAAQMPDAVIHNFADAAVGANYGSEALLSTSKAAVQCRRNLQRIGNGFQRVARHQHQLLRFMGCQREREIQACIESIAMSDNLPWNILSCGADKRKPAIHFAVGLAFLLV